MFECLTTKLESLAISRDINKCIDSKSNIRNAKAAIDSINSSVSSSKASLDGEVLKGKCKDSLITILDENIKDMKTLDEDLNAILSKIDSQITNLYDKQRELQNKNS